MIADALQMHRGLIFGKRASDIEISEMEHRQALKVLEQQDAVLPKATVLRCRVRYFSDGAIWVVGIRTQFRWMRGKSRRDVATDRK